MDATQMTGAAGAHKPSAGGQWTWGLREAMHLPRAYASYIALSAMDGIGTGLILWLGGREVNPIADAVLGRFGFPGMIVFKFALVLLVIVFCEHIVRERPGTAKAVIGLAIGVSTLPVLVAGVEFTCHLLSPG